MGLVGLIWLSVAASEWITSPYGRSFWRSQQRHGSISVSSFFTLVMVVIEEPTTDPCCLCRMFC